MRRYLVAALVVLNAGAVLAVLPAVAAQTRTMKPMFHRAHYVVKAGHSVNVLLGTHARWRRPESCQLVVSGPDYPTRTWIIRAVQADLLMAFLASRHVRPGNWRLRVRCLLPGKQWSSWAHSIVRASGRASGRVPLVTSHGPYLTALSPGGAAIAGFGGVGISPNPFQNGECTYYAYERRPDIYLQSVNANPGALAGGWDARVWATRAAQYGHFQEGAVPAVGALMVEPGTPSSPDGHVAYVSQVQDAGHFVTQEMNTDGRVTANKVFTVYNDFGAPHGAYYDDVSRQLHRHVVAGTVFIYGGPVLNPPQYAGELGHIVQWDGDTKTQKTAWLVVDEGGALHRHWIPSIATYWCLKNSGAPGPDVLPAAELNALTDDTGVQATCSGNNSGPGGGGGGGPNTYSELEGHNGTNTFSDPATASGEGARIDPGQTVEVACKVYDPQIASVNPDGYWYQIADSPWDDGYYAPANTFMNGDPWNGPYTHNTDFSVPDCGGGTPTTTTTTLPPPTWSETTGGVTHTWTDYQNAGGAEGQLIASNQTVQVACAVQGFAVADGDTWWYRIASSPWNGSYYASADAFYNNGQSSGSLSGTPFVDLAVAHC